MTADDLAPLAAEEYCYVTTTGRRSGRPHRIEIWFGLVGATAYILSNRVEADWVQNLLAHPDATVEIGDRTFAARGRLVEPGTDEEERARTLVYEKYRTRDDLESWRHEATPVALDLAPVR